MGKASGVMLYQVPNRGNVFPPTPDDGGPLVGNVVLTSGWQGDIPPRAGLQTISVPVARHPDGSSVTGVALTTLANMPPGSRSLPLIAASASARPGRSRPAWIRPRPT